MKIVTKIYPIAAAVFLSGCVSNNDLTPFDTTHPAHPQAETGAVYSAPTTLSLNPLSRLDERVEDPMAGMSHSNHQMMRTRNGEPDHSNMEGMDHSKMEGMDHSKMEDMDHGETDGDGHSHASEDHDGSAHIYSVGEPASAVEADRTVRVIMADTMAYTFTPHIDSIQNGEVINFLVTNEGETAHEFSIGNHAERQGHASMMLRMPNMVHDNPNTITVRHGESKSLAWRFKGDDLVAFACNVPGHHHTGGFKYQIISAQEHSHDSHSH